MDSNLPPNIDSLEQLELASPPSLVLPSSAPSDTIDATGIPAESSTLITPIAPEIISVVDPTTLLIQLIEQSLSIPISMPLTSDEVNLLKQILSSSPSSFQNIENSLNKIISDNKINAEDIPEFLQLIKDVHDLITNTNSKSNNILFTGTQLVTISANIIKFIIPIILKKNGVNDEKLGQTINAIIDSATTLLLFIPQVNKVKCKLFCF